MADEVAASMPPPEDIHTEEVPVIIPKLSIGNDVAGGSGTAATHQAESAAAGALATSSALAESLVPEGSKETEEFRQQQGDKNGDASEAVSGSEDINAVETDAASYKKKRLCRTPGCNRVIKSQGHCQRHGAKAKRCKVLGCDKQAQGTHNGMCKRHWKAVNFPDRVAATPARKVEAAPPPPEGTSVYDGVLPQSISYRPHVLHRKQLEESNKVNKTENPPQPPAEVSIMPLVIFFREGAGKEPGWHRNAERRARGMFPVTSMSSQLEPWERQLCLVEILLLSGGTPFANFKDLTHAWGRERGFHSVLTGVVCERRGEVDRKRRSDIGQQRSFKQKIQRIQLPDASSLHPAVNAVAAAAAVMAQVGGVPPQQQQHLQVDQDDKMSRVQV